MTGDSKLRLVMGAGHNGSKWFATVLDAQAYIRADHEMRMTMCRMPWTKAHRYGPRDAVNAAYWKYIDHMFASGVDIYYDCNSWMPWEVPDIPIPIDRIVYLVRNPIVQLESLRTTVATWKRYDAASWEWNFWLRNWWSAANRYDLDVGITGFDDMSEFGKLCLMVAGNATMPSLLQDGYNHARVDVVKLESLVDDERFRELRRYVDMHPDDMRRWTARDINRHTTGDRSPETIWWSWTDEERETFNSLVAVPMRDLMYVAPDGVEPRRIH